MCGHWSNYEDQKILQCSEVSFSSFFTSFCWKQQANLFFCPNFNMLHFFIDCQSFQSKILKTDLRGKERFVIIVILHSLIDTCMCLVGDQACNLDCHIFHWIPLLILATGRMRGLVSTVICSVLLIHLQLLIIILRNDACEKLRPQNIVIFGPQVKAALILP